MLSRSALFSVILAFLVLLAGCSDDATAPETPPGVDTRGDIVSVTEIGTFAPADIQALVAADPDFQLPPGMPLLDSVTAYRFVYETVLPLPNGTKAEAIQASGALLVPLNDTPKRVLTLLHGTESKRDLVASVHPANSNEGLVGICLAAGGGSVVCLPDYPGFGVSEVDHPYFDVEANVPAIIDMMRATQSWCAENEVNRNGLHFLTGYSEGGFFAYHTQRVLEESHADEFTLTAVAPMAGPYDLAGTVASVLTDSEYVDLAYVGFIFTAFDRAYGLGKLDEIFREPYAALMPSLYDGSRTWGEILSSLPATFDALVKADFVARYLAGNEPEMAAAFAENTIFEWSPQAPMMFFHGNADRIVPLANATTAVQHLNAHGAQSVDLVVIEGGTHATAGGPAVLGMLQWFATFDAD